jgi:pimeloyl-ACP methyl ester carboxylesterase
MLHHGIAGSHYLLKLLGYTDKIRKHHQLILIDARGHGRSDKPHKPNDYRLKHFVDDTVAVLNDLGIDKSHFLGFSMGGRVGLGIGVYSPHRFKSLIIGSSGMYETDTEEQIKRQQIGIENYSKGIDAMFANVSKGLGWLPSEVLSKFKDEYYRNNPEALIAIRSMREHVGFKDLLPSLELPCLFYVGDKEAWLSVVKQTAELIPNARLVSLPGLDHMGVYSNFDMVLPHVLNFIKDVQ